jgi:hypothetical protein
MSWQHTPPSRPTRGPRSLKATLATHGAAFLIGSLAGSAGVLIGVVL